MGRTSLEVLEEAGLRPPTTLTLSITRVCNLVCRHCWVEADATPTTTQVPTAQLRRVMEEFADLGGQELRLTGGEPLCHPDWLELTSLARRLRFKRLVLQTNGMLFDNERVAALRILDFPGLSIQVSLDGATAPAHDLIRGKGAFDKTLQGLHRLIGSGLGPRVTLFFTEMRHNLSEIPDLLELARNLGISRVVAGSLVLCGRAAEDAILAPAGLEQYLDLLDRYERDLSFRELYAQIGKVAALEWYTAEALHPECCAFVESPYLSPEGRLYPCVMCHSDDYAVSDVFSKSLAAVYTEGATLWTSLLQISRSRAVSIPQCRDCPDGHACAGGCLGRAWGSCGDFLSVEDRCALRREIYTRRKALSHRRSIPL